MGLTKEQWDEVSHERLLYLEDSWVKYRQYMNGRQGLMTQDQYILFWNQWLCAIKKLRESGYDLSKIRIEVKPQKLPGVL